MLKPDGQGDLMAANVPLAAAIPSRRHRRRVQPSRGRPPAKRPQQAGVARGRFAPQAVRFLDPRARRTAAEHVAAIARCQFDFDAACGVLAARGEDSGPPIDRLTRAARERAVDLAITALNDAEATRRLLAMPEPGAPAAARTAEQERAAKLAMMAHFRVTSRQRARPRADCGLPAALTLRVRPDHLTMAGRAALQALLREAAVQREQREA